MKITLNWLKRYTDYQGTPDELKEQLTLLGMEVEDMKRTSAGFDGIVVGQVLESKQHPNAEKLSVNRVADGRGERTVVCGASNFKVGDKVPLALPGCVMPQIDPKEEPFMIKVSKLRGVESQGMMCSGRELGLSQDHSGLMILPEDATVGQPFSEYLGRGKGDVTYDMEITPNRPDWNSVIGIAREISALTGMPLTIPPVSDEALEAITDPDQPIENYVGVRLEDAELCPRYVARVIRGVKVGPSPDWLRETLEKVGLRSINNIVDVTNFIMLETGQPLHAFDYHLLKAAEGASKPMIVVRRAAEGEKFTTLDGEEHTLSAEMQVIADETRATALAGVMGGLNTEINDQTVDVLLESACFKPQNIRATSKKLGLRTDASYRYERGSDVGICEYASRRAAQLFVQLAGGKICKGVVDAWPVQPKEKKITLRYERTDALLGVRIAPARQKAFLANLELTPVPEATPELEASQVTVKIPTYRVDLKREADLIEEVGRLYGVDKIPSRLMIGSLGSNPYDKVVDFLNDVRSLLVGLGFYETQGQTLISKTSAECVCPHPVELKNPLSSDMDVLRPSLLPGLLTCVTHNINHGTSDVALFEIGRVFIPSNGKQYTEQLKLALVMTGQRSQLFWSGAERSEKCDLFDLKGALEVFAERMGLKGFVFNRSEEPHPLFVEWGKIVQGKAELGRFGQVFPPLVRKMDMRDPVFMAEWNLELVQARSNSARSFKPINDFPVSRRDVAMLVDSGVTHDSVMVVVKKAKPSFLEKVELFDIFKGKGIPEDKKSMAYAFTYRHNERTLTEQEVNSDHQKVLESLQSNLHATLR